MLGVAPASALAGSISGSLTDAETGAPVTDSLVCAYGVNGGGYCVGVPANGEYAIGSLPADEYRVSFRAYPGNNYAPQYWQEADIWDDATLIALGADEDRTGIDAALEPGAMLSGTVVGEGEIGPLEGVQVCTTDLVRPGGLIECVETDADGEYQLTGLRSGSYRVTFSTPWSSVEYATRYYDEKAFEDEADELQLTAGESATADATMSPAGAIEGTVTGEGEPLEWAWVCAYTLAGDKLGCAPTDEDGHYRYGGLPAGSYVLEVEGYGFMPEFSGDASTFEEATPVTVLAGETTPFDADLSAPPGIEGTVTAAASGEPLESVRVCAVPDFESTTSCVYTWEDGSYKIENLGTDSYTVSFEADGYAIQYYDGVLAESEATKVPVSDGMVSGIDAELVPGGLIKGHVTLASSGANLGSVKACALRADGSEAGCDSTATSSGIFEIEDIPVGEYKVRFTRSSYVTQYFNGKATFEAADPVTVAAGETTEGVDAAMVKLDKPKNTALPALTGVGKVGETLACSDGTWSGNPSKYEYYWYRNGFEIQGALLSTYKLVSGDAGKTISCAVETWNSAGWSDQALAPTSIQVAAIRQLTVSKAGTGSGSVTSSPSGIDCGSTCSTSGNQGETITLTAAPAQHSQLSGWAGCTTSSGTECTVTLGGANASVTATFAPITHTVSVAVTGGGSVSAASGAITGCTPSGGACSGSYDETSEVVLTATPNAHQSFTGWTGCTTAAGTECKVTVDGAENVTAGFAPILHELEVAKTGGGSGSVTSNPAGIDCGSTCADEFEEGSTITLSATPAQHSEFTGWSGGGCSGTATCAVTLGADIEVSAGFAPITHGVSVAVTGGGSVSAASGAIAGCTASAGTCNGSYDEGAEVVLTATPAAHQSFSGWSGCTTATGAECKVTIDGAESVTATFAQITHELSVSKAGTGSGSVTSTPVGIDCGSLCATSFDEGEEVGLTATPAADSEFTGWSGGGCTGTGTCTVSVEADTAVTATFAKKATEGGTVIPPPTPPTPGPAPKPKPKPLKCKKGFKKKKVKGKQRCVKVKKKQSGKRA
ncbi:MAG TPA: carboxypeptidase regulatory-like domain-containing protein [Solirubrobacterales bacterium]|nr:carboxypeptidase regulatory-like domain-containing protein [Solirubrobacterales bacterium]